MAKQAQALTPKKKYRVKAPFTYLHYRGGHVQTHATQGSVVELADFDIKGQEHKLELIEDTAIDADDIIEEDEKSPVIQAPPSAQTAPATPEVGDAVASAKRKLALSSKG